MAKLNNKGEESFNKTELYLTYYPAEEDDSKDVINVPLLTLVTVFVVKVAGIGKSNVKIIFKAAVYDKDNDGVTFDLKRDKDFNFSEDSESNNDLVESCILPAIYVPAFHLCVTGLCSVLRRLFKTGDVEAQSFLGHQGSCLSAPAEVSSWTRFCEIDLPDATLKFLDENFSSNDVIQLPVDLARFEEHMKQPIKMHNIRKRMGKMTSSRDGEVTLLMQNCKILENGRQVATDEQGREVDPIELFARSQHVFAEGPDCLLSDLILFPHVHLILTKLFSISSEENVAGKLPLTLKWYRKMLSHHRNALNVMSLFHDHLETTNDGKSKMKALKLPEVPSQSLYKSDPKRNNPASRVFTRQHEVERVLAKVSESTGLELLSSKIDESGNPEDVKLDWTSFPRDVHPMGGELPLDRIEKKCHQLENMASAVLHLVGDGDRIVDFCSGGGHLGIVLAYLMPTATVYLVENKEESLMRAVKRVQRLGLTNCRFFQGNMDYFSGKFDVGVSLHACGVATDLVIRTCIENKASFVCCPCCYGSVQENHILSYPRSKHFRQKSITFQEYLILGHTADQTHVTNVKHNQGQFAMDTVDSDRAHFAREAGYSEVILSKMKPENCTPKNNLIVAAFSK